LISPSAFSATCKGCGQYLRIQELLKPAAKAPPATRERKHIVCFDCAAEFDVPVGAQSTMCKKCSSYIDLADYSISNAVSKNFKTKGSFQILPTGYVFNSETLVREAVIKGRFIGKLVVEGSLTLHSTAQIKGSFTAARLVVPAANQFRWDAELKVGSVEVEGELVANLNVRSVCVKAQGRLLGTIKAQSLLAEAGAVVMIYAQIGAPGAAPSPARTDAPVLARETLS
jgi:cytoskeletal protein CcmA (bactofilin family)